MQRFFDVVQDRSGNAIPGALVYVYASGGGLATLYSDNGVTTTPNPVTTNFDGEYGFYAANGTYSLTITATGYASDSRPGVIIFDPSDAGASGDIDFLPAGTGAVTRTVQAKLRDVVSVKDFGATGDGVTNDTTALTNAFAAANGKALYFPAGTYLTNPLTLNSSYNNIFVYGDGAGSILKLVGAATGSPSAAILSLVQCANISFAQLKFDGNSAAQSSNSTWCVYMRDGATNIKFNDVWFFNSYDDNVFLAAFTGWLPVKNVSFTDCRFQTNLAPNNSNVQLWNTEDIKFQGCYFTDWTYDAIAINYFSPAVNGGLIVDSCYFQNTNSDLFAIEAVANGGAGGTNEFRIKNVVISNNIFDANNKTTLGASGISGWMDYASITGNTWRRSGSGSWRQGIEAIGNYWTISGNILDDGRIVVSADSVASSGKNYTVTNNSVRVNGGSEMYAIQVGYDGTFDGLVISNNTIDLIGITGPNSGGINIGTYNFSAIVKNAICSGNTISHNSAVTSVNGIRFETAAGSQNINNNSIVNADSGIRANSAVATDVEISGNDFRGCNTNIDLPATGIYRVFDNTFSATYQLVSADRGDASVTVVNGVDAPTQVFNTPLTTNRTVTLSSTNAFAGATFTVVRTAAATGASTLSVGGLKTLAAGQTCAVQYNGTAWFLLSFGSL
jgi:hypothetical protein